MKPLVVTLAALSLAANLVLVGLLLAGRSHTETPAPALSSPADTAPKPSAAVSELWQNLTAGDDLAASVQRLRDLGLPAHIIRAIISARVSELFAPRFKALRNDNAASYWKNATVDARVRQAEYQLYREQQKMLRDLLGPDAESPDMNIFSRLRLDSVPASKLDAVKDAFRLAEDRRQEVFQNIMGMITPETQRKLDAIGKDHQATLAGILTSTELEEYNLRNSDVSQNLRYELTAFEPTEEEFRSIYKVWSQLDPFVGGLSQEEMQRRGNAQQKAREQIKTMLGPVRGAEYERASDHSYRQTSMLVSRLELPPETTLKVWEVKQDIEKRVGPIRMDRALSPEARTQQLAALAAEGTQRVTALVGARGIEAYKTQGAGFWLQNLQPRPTPPPR